MAATAVKPDADEEVRQIDVVDAGALTQLARGEIDIQIATAKRYPRSIATFKKQALEMATLDEETAESMFYALPRGGKTIEGPSVRLAEIVASAWGNLRSGARVTDVGDRHLVSQGTAFDLEKNFAVQMEVRRRITNKSGKRYDDDMIGVTSNAACSIAFRESIFKVVPRAYVRSIYEMAKRVAVGEGQPMGARRERAFEFFKKLGATPEQVLKMLGVSGIDDVNTDHLVILSGLRTAIKDGDTSLEDAFREAGVIGGGGTTVVVPQSLTLEGLAGASASGHNNAEAPKRTPTAEDGKVVELAEPEPPTKPAATDMPPCGHPAVPPSRLAKLGKGKSLSCPDCGEDLTNPEPAE
jgi:hypothetical protein